MAKFKKKWELTSNTVENKVPNPEDFKGEFSTTQSTPGFDLSFKASVAQTISSIIQQPQKQTALTNDDVLATAKIISKKNQLITKSELNSIGKNIKLVAYDPLQNLITDSNKTSSPRLLNWVEPYDIGEYTKTLFWTSVNSGFKVGDRVFIVNGNYDINDLISADKYKAGRDGYKVLFVDKCRVVLDIDYTGVLPFNEDDVDKFYQLYYIKSDNEFLTANRQLTSRKSSLDYKFNSGNNVLAYVDKDYGAISGWGKTSGLSGSPGFFIKNGISNSWTKLTQFLTSTTETGRLAGALDTTTTFGIARNKRLLVIGGDFVISGQSFKEGFVYKWVDTSPGVTQGWKVDTTYMQPLIGKSNFRAGVFNGEFNSGIFGQQTKQITWTGDKSTWNLGTLLNATWTKGKFNSLYSFTQSYFSSFDNLGLPYQKLNSPNNADRGYNFIFDSDLTEINMDNGSIYRTTIGAGSATYSVVEDEILSTVSPFNKVINKGYFNNCYINNSWLLNAEIKNSRSQNSRFEKSKGINSYFKNSVFKNSIYRGDDIIKIIGYDELTASLSPDNTGTGYSTISNVVQKVYKFYITKASWERLKDSDSFYIKGLKLRNLNSTVINFFDKKFTIGSWTEYNEENSGIKNQGKRGYLSSAFLSTPGDNSRLFTSVNTPGGKYYTKHFGTNPNSDKYSIDVWVSLYDTSNSLMSEVKNFNKRINSSPESSPKDNGKIGDIVDISSAYIQDSDFESGLFTNSNWISGNHIERNNDSNISVQTKTGGNLNLSLISPTTLQATTHYTSTFPETSLVPVGNILFLDSVDNNDGTTITRLPDSWKVSKNTSGVYQIKEVNTSVLSTITLGTFLTYGIDNRYNHFKTLKFSKSIIQSGIFRRSYFRESVINNLSYDHSDKDLNNIENNRSLVIVDSIFSDGENFLGKATYHTTFFKGGTDKNIGGISIFSDFTGVTFSNGVIRNSRWKDGNFSTGTFYLSRTFNGTASSTRQNVNNDNLFTWWRKGTSPTFNNRFSWQSGTFSSGLFLKSDWESGDFLYGTFDTSKWYSGTFSNGIIGNSSVNASDTKFYNGQIKFATVENASLEAHDTSFGASTKKTIIWEGGFFKNGEFKTDTKQPIGNEAIWYGGTFLNGTFDSNAVWETGSFKGGKFISGFGWTFSISWTQSSATQSEYGWRNGTFEGGEFGNADLGTNSTWYDGTFKGGKFQGRIWNYGLFQGGQFVGSGFSPVGGLTSGSASQFVDSFSNSYFGHWKDGFFTENTQVYDNQREYYTERRRAIRPVEMKPMASMVNSLWQSGTFSHSRGEIIESVWLDGSFSKGRFISSSFNPYVTRENGVKGFNFNDDTCVWNSGSLEDSDFYISRWKNGNSYRNNMYGVIWENGINYYMNAYNIFWESGTWKNGNWYGSHFTTNGSFTDDYTRQILFRGMSWSGTSSLHVWNVFEGETGISSTTIATGTASSPTSETPLDIIPVSQPISGPNFALPLNP